MLKSTSAHTHKWKSAKSSNTVIQHDAEFNTVASKGNQQETGSETNFGTVAWVTAEGPHDDIQNGKPHFTECFWFGLVAPPPLIWNKEYLPAPKKKPKQNKKPHKPSSSHEYLLQLLWQTYSTKHLEPSPPQT